MPVICDVKISIGIECAIGLFKRGQTGGEVSGLVIGSRCRRHLPQNAIDALGDVKITCGTHRQTGEKPESRKLESEEQLLTVTLDEALWLFSQPKRYGRSAPKPPLADLGTDPATGRPMVVKDGRFGPYVTDGETHASLQRGDVPETLSPERGAELLQGRRDWLRENGGAAKKSAAKKTAAKKSAKKSTAKAGGKTGTKARAGKPSSLTSRVVGAGQSKAAKRAAKGGSTPPTPDLVRSESQILDPDR